MAEPCDYPMESPESDRTDRTEPCEGMIDPASTSLGDHDKLRIIAAIVEDQAPFGTELANFRRRLRAIIRL